MRSILSIPLEVYNKLKYHLLPKKMNAEEAAFVFASKTIERNNLIFQYKELFTVKENEFLCRTPYHFELSEEIRPKIIKKGHDLNCSIVEFHSHLGSHPACFSYSDWCGFDEFVPHILWRLKGKHYIAVVMTRSGFDSLIWKDKENDPEFLDLLSIGRDIIYPTKLSLPRRKYYDKKPL